MPGDDKAAVMPALGSETDAVSSASSLFRDVRASDVGDSWSNSLRGASSSPSAKLPHGTFAELPTRKATNTIASSVGAVKPLGCPAKVHSQSRKIESRSNGVSRVRSKSKVVGDSDVRGLRGSDIAKQTSGKTRSKCQSFDSSAHSLASTVEAVPVACINLAALAASAESPKDCPCFATVAGVDDSRSLVSAESMYQIVLDTAQDAPNCHETSSACFSQPLLDDQSFAEEPLPSSSSLVSSAGVDVQEEPFARVAAKAAALVAAAEHASSESDTAFAALWLHSLANEQFVSTRTSEPDLQHVGPRFIATDQRWRVQT